MSSINEQKIILKNLDREIKNKINYKETELANIEALHKKELETKRSAHESAYIEQMDRHQAQLLSENSEYENKLKDYQDKLSKTKSTLETEEKNLKGALLERLEDIKLKNTDKILETIQNAEQQNTEIKNSSQSTLKMIEDKGNFEKNKLIRNKESEIQEVAQFYDQKNLVEEKDLRERLRQDLLEHQNMIVTQKENFQKDVKMSQNKNERLLKEKIKVQEENINFQEKYHQSLMQQKNEDFKKRYEHLTNEHNQILQDIKTKLDEDIKKLVVSNSKIEKSIKEKAEDPFYRLNYLNPKVVENDKDVLVSIPVAEHEKENVQLSTNGRQIKISMSKKYGEILEDDKTKEVNRNSRTELLSKEFLTKDILNPKDIGVHYQNGLLTFKVAKL